MIFGFSDHVSPKSARIVRRGSTRYLMPPPYCKAGWKMPPPFSGGVLPKSKAALINPMLARPRRKYPLGLTKGASERDSNCKAGPAEIYGRHRDLRGRRFN